MIHFNNITRQHGSQVLFRNASFQILANARTGLVGPNGAGKTTIFRLITGEEQPDKGEVSRPGQIVIGYFSQDIGEMSGRQLVGLLRLAVGRQSQDLYFALHVSI